MAKIIFRKVITIDGNQYAVDEYENGRHGPIDPTDSVVLDEMVGTNNLLIVEKGEAPPPTDKVTAQDQSLSTATGTPLMVTLVATTSLPTAHIGGYTITSQPTSGALAPGGLGQYTYTPDAAFSGNDSFSFTATDDQTPPNTSNTATVSIAVGVTPPPPSKVDVFGITKVYDDMPGTYNYWDQRDNTRWFEQTPVSAGSGWWTYPSLSQGRIEVLPVAGLKDTDIDTFHMDTLIQRGYTHKPNNSADGKGDWGGPGVGLECTVRYRNVVPGSGSFESHPEWVWGTFKQTGHGAPSMPQSCQAGSYHCNIYYLTNRAHFERDYRHTDGYIAHNPEVKGVIGINGKQEHVHKAIWWVQPNTSVPGGKGEVHMEQYLSTDGGKTFRQLQKYVDNGHMGPLKTPGAGTACGYVSDEQPATNAKCCPGIRIDFMKSFEFRDMSIRTVDFNKKLIP